MAARTGDFRTQSGVIPNEAVRPPTALQPALQSAQPLQRPAALCAGPLSVNARWTGGDVCSSRSVDGSNQYVNRWWMINIHLLLHILHHHLLPTGDVCDDQQHAQTVECREHGAHSMHQMQGIVELHHSADLHSAPSFAGRLGCRSLSDRSHSATV